MQTFLLGRTGLAVTKPAMGCLPIQRTEKDEAVRILEDIIPIEQPYFSDTF